MATINGKLLRIADPSVGFAPEEGSVLIALRGYGSQVPGGPGGTLVNLEYTIVPPNPSNPQWTAVVPGNDVIRPAGTYYTITYRNANGDIAQTEAFIFADAATYDLDFTEPFDPSLGTGPPPTPAPPLVGNRLQVVTYVPNPQFAGNAYTTWLITLTGDASPNFNNLIDGNLYIVIVIQDGAGGHAFNWPSNVHNASYVNPTPNGETVQTFVAVSGQLYATGPATYL